MGTSETRAACATTKHLIYGAFCWVFVCAFFVLPLCIFLVSKCIVILVFLVQKRVDLVNLSTDDAAFAIDSSWKKSKVSVGFLLRLDRPVDLASVQHKFTECLLEPRVGEKRKHDKLFSSLVTCGGFVFRRIIPKISVKELIHEVHLKSSCETIEELIDTWLAANYRENTPAWELILIHLQDETALAFKIHHSLADGYSLLYILNSITDNTSPYLVKNPKQSAWKTISDVIAMPMSLKTLLCQNGYLSSIPIRVLKPQNRWVYAFSTVDLQPLKTIRKQQNVHFATIILTLITGALRQFLLETKEEHELPSYIPLCDTLPWPNHPRTRLCNHWSLGVFKIAMKDDDPLSRLRETEKYFLEFHDMGLDKFVKNFVFPLTWIAPQYFLEKAVQVDPGFNAGLTSLVGGDDYQLLGYPIKHIYPLLTLVDSSPFTTFSWFTFTHSNKVDVTLGGAPDIFKDRKSLQIIADTYFKKELDKLCIQCGLCSSVSLK